MLRVTVSGSFHRHMHAISLAVQELTDLGAKVLSPADPRVVDSLGEFLFVASDRVRSVRLVQDRHVQAISASNFLWLVAPDGYVGQSASMELGFAVARDIPVLGTAVPSDLTLRQYVKSVESVGLAVQEFGRWREPARHSGLLIDPHGSVQTAHALLDRIGQSFTSAATAAGLDVR